MKLCILDEVCEFQSGLWTGKKGPFKVVKVLRNTNFTKDNKLNLENIAEIKVEVKQFEKRVLEKGDILIEKSGGGPNQPVGRVVLIDKRAVDYSFSNFTSRIRVFSDDLNPNYLYLFLNYIYLSGKTENLQRRSTGIRNLQLKEYKQLVIPVPSLQKQEKIVERLEKVFENIELKFNLYKNKIELHKQLCKSKLNQIFNDELVKSGGIKLNDLVDLQKGKKPEISQQIEGNLPYLTAKYIRGESDPEYGIPNSKGIVLVNPKDYVIIMDGSNSGEVFTGINGILASTMGKIILKQKINLKYLGYFLDFNKENLANTKTGSAIPHLSKDVFFNLQIPVPSSKDQEKIVVKLDKFFKKVNYKLKNINEEIYLVNNLKKSILNKEFSYE